MKGSLFEALMGAVVLVTAAIFLFFAFGQTDIGSVKGYTVTADFDRVDGLSVGSDVRMSGIKIGSVINQTLNPETFLAEVTMTIDTAVALPTDSSAQIVSDGLLGSKFLAIVPGGDMEVIAPGGKITLTQSPMILENLVGQLLFGGTEKGPEGNSPGN